MDYSLIRKICKCGCGREFRVLETSTCEYYSSACSGIQPKPVDPQVLAKVRREAKKIYGESYGGYNEIDGKDELTLAPKDELDSELE